MNPITEDDLILFRYRDGLDAARLADIEQELSRSPELRERYAALERTLARVDAQPVPQADADLGARLWRQLEPRLAQAGVTRTQATWRDRTHALFESLRPQRLAWAGAFALLLALGVGFYAGRQSAPAIDATASADATALRVLDAYVAAHLRATEGVLVTASNSGSDALSDGNRELAASLVESNRLYALAATRAGNARLADFLRQLEPVLMSLANQADGGAVQSSEGLRDYLHATDLLFQVRATEARLDRNGDRRT